MARNVKTISICLPGYLRTWAREKAEEQGLSVSAFLTMTLTGVYREYERDQRREDREHAEV